MFVSETIDVLSHIRMCLCTWRNDSIVYAFERILFGANVAKLSLSDIDCISFDEHSVKAKETTSHSEGWSIDNRRQRRLVALSKRRRCDMAED